MGDCGGCPACAATAEERNLLEHQRAWIGQTTLEMMREWRAAGGEESGLPKPDQRVYGGDSHPSYSSTSTPYSPSAHSDRGLKEAAEEDAEEDKKGADRGDEPGGAANNPAQLPDAQHTCYECGIFVEHPEQTRSVRHTEWEMEHMVCETCLSENWGHPYFDAANERTW
jgi:hypothetical protein